MAYKVFIREYPDRNGRMPLVGEVDTWFKLEFNVVFNGPGHWQMQVAAGTEHEKLLRQGRGVVIFQDGVEEPVFSGSIDVFERYWTNDQHTGRGSVFVNGKDDNQLPYNYLAYPSTEDVKKTGGKDARVVLRPLDRQWEGMDRRTVSGPLGTLLWEECDLAFGERALTGRTVKHAEVGADTRIGDEVKDTLRYDNLGSKFEEWLKDKYLGYRLVYNPLTQRIGMRVYKCRNLGRSIRFSPDLGNIKQYSWQLRAPSATRALVACQGEGKERYIYQAVDVVAEYTWGRIVEQFVDRRDIPLMTVRGHPELVVRTNEDGSKDIGKGPDGKPWPGETYGAQKEAAVKHYIGVVREAARRALKESEKVGRFQVYPIDTPQCAYGRDYVVGDIVTVEADGRTITDTVNEVTISVDDSGGGATVTPKIGRQGTDHLLNLYRTVSDMRRKLLLLETRV